MTKTHRICTPFRGFLWVHQNTPPPWLFHYLSSRSLYLFFPATLIFSFFLSKRLSRNLPISNVCSMQNRYQNELSRWSLNRVQPTANAWRSRIRLCAHYENSMWKAVHSRHCQLRSSSDKPSPQTLRLSNSSKFIHSHFQSRSITRRIRSLMN